MEILRGSGAVTDLNIVFGGELEEALDARTGVLRTLTFEAVRQEQNEAARLIPLGFRRDDELIDNNLRAIHKVAELRFPHDQRERIGNTVPEFIAHGGKFAEEAIHHLELRLLRIEMLQRDVSSSGGVVAEFEVPLRERPARYIFAAQANRRAFENQTAEGERFGEAPIDGRTFQHFATPIEQRLQLRMEMKLFRKRGALFDYLREHVVIRGGRRDRLIDLARRALRRTLRS